MSAISYTLCAMDAINLLISRTRRGRCAPCSPMNGSDLGPSDGIGPGQTLRRLNPAACTYTSPLWRCQRAKKYLKKDCKKIVRLQQKVKPTSPLRWHEVFFFFISLVFFLLKNEGATQKQRQRQPPSRSWEPSLGRAQEARVRARTASPAEGAARGQSKTWTWRLGVGVGVGALWLWHNMISSLSYDD